MKPTGSRRWIEAAIVLVTLALCVLIAAFTPPPRACLESHTENRLTLIGDQIYFWPQTICDRWAER